MTELKNYDVWLSTPTLVVLPQAINKARLPLWVAFKHQDGSKQLGPVVCCRMLVGRAGLISTSWKWGMKGTASVTLLIGDTTHRRALLYLVLFQALQKFQLPRHVCLLPWSVYVCACIIAVSVHT